MATTFPRGGVALNLTGNEFANQIPGGAGVSVLNGLDGNDIIYGFGGLDFLGGGMGNDYLIGDDDGDSLLGDLGNDSLFGGNGADRLLGGVGIDLLVGGAVGDVFKFTGSTDSLINGLDVITDFVNGAAKLDFSSFAGTSGPFTIGTLQASSGPRIKARRWGFYPLRKG